MVPSNIQAVVNPDNTVTVTWDDSDTSQDTNESCQFYRNSPQYLDNKLLDPGVTTCTFGPIKKKGTYKCYATSLWETGNPQNPNGAAFTQIIDVEVP